MTHFTLCLAVWFCHISKNNPPWLCGVEVAGWTVDREMRVFLPANHHRLWALWWQGGKRRPRTSQCQRQGRLGTLKTPSCPWRLVLGSRSKCGNWTNVLSRYSWNIAEYDNKPQPTDKPTNQHLQEIKKGYWRLRKSSADKSKIFKWEDNFWYIFYTLKQ